jgi:predicted dehydrogenase/threonine dehydrogenase-like Zn-dependent dehydrogenase
MRQVAQNYKTGELVMLDVAAPACREGGVLVRTEYSLVSAGTEMMKVGESKMSLLGKARARPDQVRRVLDSIAQQGLAATYRKVMNRLDSFTPLGYSMAGIVEEVGDGVTDLTVGQRVACGGNLYAHHAEFDWVPRNLCAVVPEGVDPAHAAFTTVGAIAMQAFRQSDARLGETACVIGLGLIGQLLVQILHGAGVHVVGVDLSEGRCRLAQESGAAAAVTGGKEALGELDEVLMALTDGAGADHIFLAASTDSRDPVFLAAELARDRGRIVDVGKCNLDLPWGEYYEKELEVRFSRSYGPGRYDPVYEEQGIDYPIGYVRWTERRNMKAFLELLAEGRIDLSSLISGTYHFEEAVDVYERLHRGEIESLGVLFRYQEEPSGDVVTVAEPSPEVASHFVPPRRPVLRLGFIGMGNYATSMLAPHLKSRSDVELAEVATATALSGATAQRRFGFGAATTDFRHVLENDDIDAVVIATRHDSHARIVAEALRAGKATFVEKPLGVGPRDLDLVLRAVEESGNDRLMVGFNRRFAPLLQEMKEAWGPRHGPVVLQYVVTAGKLEGDSWYRQADLHGTRFIGEGCHFVDTVSWWLDSDPVEVFAMSTPDDPDNIGCMLRYPDGSMATVSYVTSRSARRHPKEVLSAYGEGKAARLGNFTRFDLWSGRRHRVRRSFRGVDKGQRGELEAFVSAVLEGTAMPISLISLVATTEATFAAHRSAGSKRVEPLRSYPLSDPGMPES